MTKYEIEWAYEDEEFSRIFVFEAETFTEALDALKEEYETEEHQVEFIGLSFSI